MSKIKTAILISGRGSNMVSLAKAAKAADFPAQIDLVISNRPDVLGLGKARELGLEALCIDHKTFKSRRKFEAALHDALKEANIELVCCAGFMRVLTPWFVSRWEGKLINIHPSLLPKYKGLNTHQRAIDAGDKIHGCSVHYVSEELDAGAVIAQAKIDILPGDTADTLSRRMLSTEHALYITALEEVCRARLTP